MTNLKPKHVTIYWLYWLIVLIILATAAVPLGAQPLDPTTSDWPWSSPRDTASEINKVNREISGSYPWIWLLCKYADDGSEPATPAYFEGLRNDLNDYYQQTSYGQADITGSDVAGWYTLPQPRSYYVDGSDPYGFSTTKLAADCTAATDADIDFTQYWGLNIMVNGTFGSIYGLSWVANLTLDGETRRWPAVYIDNKGGYNMALTGHEMLHAFQLGHSGVAGVANYADLWDPMGSACGFGSCTPLHLPTPQKDELTWISSAKIYTTTTPGTYTVTLDALTRPNAGNYLMAKIPIGENYYYTVEARYKEGYDSKIPGSAVIIHEYVPLIGQFGTATVNVVPVPGQSQPGGSGAMWLPGSEPFIDTTHQVMVQILEQTANGYRVRIDHRPPRTQVVYVDADATGANDGTSWTDAYSDLQTALTSPEANGYDTFDFWVAEGVYKPTGEDDRQARFVLQQDFHLYGGFDGTEDQRADRDSVAHLTILSGDLFGNDNGNVSIKEPTRADNSYSVLFNQRTGTVVDGVTITGGNADDLGNFSRGGGLYNDGGAITLNNVIFVANSAVDGGAVANLSGDMNLANVLFNGNTTEYNGGGLYSAALAPFPGQDPQANVVLVNSTFVHNRADTGGFGEGGGIYNDGSDITVANTVLWGNSDSQNGAGAMAQLASSEFSSGTYDVSYSLVQGGYTGTGNLSADPSFIDADGPDDTAGTLDDDLHLQDGSPAIDAGDNARVAADVADLDGDGDTTEALPFDLAGNPRLVDHPQLDTGSGTAPLVDMGAYETPAPAVNLPPHQPQDPGPVDGAADVLLRPVLSWSGGDPDGDPVTYTVALGISSPPPTVATTAHTSYTVASDLMTGTLYYWRVIASDGVFTATGPIWSLTTTVPAPEPPEFYLYLPLVLR